MGFLRSSRTVMYVGLVGVVLYFLACAALFLEGLGLETNEAFEPLHALKMLRMQTDVPFPHTLMTSPYEAHFISYPLYYLFAIFGPSVFISRFIFAFFSLLSLSSIFYVIKRWFGGQVAFITVFLLGINMNFIRGTRAAGLHDEIVQIALLWSAIALVQAYLDGKKKTYLYASGFFIGLALWVKIISLDFLVGFLAGLALFGRKGLRSIRERLAITRKDVLILLVMFLLGASPFLIFNVLTRGATFRYLWEALSRPTMFGYNNLAYAENLSLRLRHLFDFLSYRNAPEMLYTATVANSFHLWMFVVSFAGVVLYVAFSRNGPLSRKRLLFLIFAYASLFALLPFVPQQPRIEHLIILFPFFQIVEAAFIFLLYWFLKGRVVSVVLISTMVVPHVSLEFRNAYGFLKEVRAERGAAYFSPVVKDIATYAKKQRIKKLFAMSQYLLDCNIDFLTGLEVRVRELPEVYPYDGRDISSDEVMTAVYDREMGVLKEIYVIVRRDGEFSGSGERALEALSRIAPSRGKKLVLLKRFSGKGGAPLFDLYLFR